MTGPRGYQEAALTSEAMEAAKGFSRSGQEALGVKSGPSSGSWREPRSGAAWVVDKHSVEAVGPRGVAASPNSLYEPRDRQPLATMTSGRLLLSSVETQNGRGAVTFNGVSRLFRQPTNRRAALTSAIKLSKCA